MLALIAKYPQLADSSLVPSLDLPLTEPSQMLKDLQGRMSEDFPPFPSKDGSFKTSVTISRVISSTFTYFSKVETNSSRRPLFVSAFSKAASSPAIWLSSDSRRRS